MGSLSSLILIYVSIQRLLAYLISDFQGNAVKCSFTASVNDAKYNNAVVLKFMIESYIF